MLTTFWSVKGGVGVSTVTALFALAHAGRADPTLIVDMCGDQPALLGIDEVEGPGLREWAATPGRTVDALDRITGPVKQDLRIVGCGAVPWPTERDARSTVAVLNDRSERVFVDAGTATDPFSLDLVARSAQRLLVLRCCYLTLRAAKEPDPEPTGIVLIRERGRALGIGDVEAVTGAPVVAEIAFDISVARSIDAGLATSRVPKGLLRTLALVGARDYD